MPDLNENGLTVVEVGQELAKTLSSVLDKLGIKALVCAYMVDTGDSEDAGVFVHGSHWACRGLSDFACERVADQGDDLDMDVEC